jgi:hypothetical protein
MHEHGIVMADATYENPRRSKRVFMRIRVVAEGKDVQARRFREACHTIVVNAHGALIYLHKELGLGSMLMLSNPFSQEEQECRVVYVGEECDKGQRVGIEFLAPAPHFWGVDFQPADWAAKAKQTPAPVTAN